jgi:oligoribonuclease (3'-5' exoribonuclease)
MVGAMPNVDKTIKPTKLLWIDLEMTGLDPQQDVILEVAAEITDFELNTVPNTRHVCVSRARRCSTACKRTFGG